MVWQNLNLFPWRSVIDNVAFGLEMKGVAKAERRERARRLIASVGLRGFENHLPAEISGERTSSRYVHIAPSASEASAATSLAAKR